MPEPFDNARITQLVLAYQAALNGSRDPLFCEIVEAVLPLLHSTIFRYRWDLTLGEEPEELVNRIVLKLPNALLRWQAGRGTTFYNYFMNVTMNAFRHLYAKRMRRSRYAGEMPGEEIPDFATERLNGNLSTMQQRGHEFERACLLIPGELAELVDPEYGGLVHYIATRYLQRADNGQTLFFSELRKEVSLLPSAASLTGREIDAMVRMVVAGVRSRLYSLRPVEADGEGEGLGFLYNPDGGSTSIGFLSHSSYRLWPLLLILDPPTTRLVLHCLAGLVESVPSRDKWIRERTNGEAYANEAIV